MVRQLHPNANGAETFYTLIISGHSEITIKNVIKHFKMVQPAFVYINTILKWNFNQKEEKHGKYLLYE